MKHPSEEAMTERTLTERLRAGCTDDCGCTSCEAAGRIDELEFCVRHCNTHTANLESTNARLVAALKDASRRAMYVAKCRADDRCMSCVDVAAGALVNIEEALAAGGEKGGADEL
jgi:hypothetical protein